MEQNKHTVEDKAKELKEKFQRWHFQAEPIQQDYFAKQCALIAVDEIMQEHNLFICTDATFHQENRKRYWQSVKSAINNL